MDYSCIISNAEKLKRQSGFKNTVIDSVKDILYKLNTIISDAHELGMSKVEYKMPINFQSPDENISNLEMQTHIYYKVVEELEKKNYSVKLKFFEKYTVIYIEWTVRVDKTEFQRMKEKLLELSKK